MKESTFTFLMGVALVVVACFDGDIRGLIGLVMGFCFLLVSRICAAIEKNGRGL